MRVAFRRNYKLIIKLAVIAGLVIGIVPKVSAASLTNISDQLSRLKVGTLASHIVRFNTPSGVQFSDTVTLQFGQAGSFSFAPFSVLDYEISVGNNADCDTSTFTPLTIGAGGLPGVGQWGVALAGDPVVVTLTAPTAGTGQIPVNTCMQLKIGSVVSGGTDVITNPAIPGTHRIFIAGSFGDTGFYDEAINLNDQVFVSAKVLPFISFNVTPTKIEFGNSRLNEARYATGGLGSGGSEVEIPAHIMTASTNIIKGYNISVSGPSLTSTQGVIDPIGGVPQAIVNGQEQFGIRITSSGGLGVVSYPYDQTFPARYAYQGHLTNDEVAKALGSTSMTLYQVYYAASIAKNTPLGAYATNFKYIATANL